MSVLVRDVDTLRELRHRFAAFEPAMLDQVGRLVGNADVLVRSLEEIEARTREGVSVARDNLRSAAARLAAVADDEDDAYEQRDYDEARWEAAEATAAYESAGRRRRLFQDELERFESEVQRGHPLGDRLHAAGSFLARRHAELTVYASGSVAPSPPGSKRSRKNEPRIQGFGKPQSPIRSEGDVRDYLEDHLPDAHWKLASSIRYEPRAQVDAKGARLLGQTHLPSRAITLYPHEGAEANRMMRDTLAHEIAHLVWRHRLAPSQRLNWTRLHEARPEGARVTSYADTDAEEDFCETYAFFANDEATVAEFFPPEHAFMSSTVFGAAEEQA